MQTIFVQIKCELGQSYRVAEELVEIDVYQRSTRYPVLMICSLSAT